jgi:hypothetical protein
MMSSISSVVRLNPQRTFNSMPPADRQAASALLDEARETADPHVELRCRVAAALLHGHSFQMITRNLGVHEKTILSIKATYDQKGIAGLR